MITSGDGMSHCPLMATEDAVGIHRDAFFRRLTVGDSAVQTSILQLVQQELQTLIDARADTVLDFLPAIVRLARRAPFPAIRECMAQLQTTIQAEWATQLEGVDTSCRVSYFVDDSDVENVATNLDAQVSDMFRAEYLRTGRVSHFVQLLAWHKRYLQLYQQSIVSIMVHDGVLPSHWRSYIALMAASELRCHYLADLQQYYFVVNGGAIEWTKGIDYIAPKLFRVHELSSLLAHRPWLITSQHISDLLACDQDDSWSVAELVHAIIIMCQYHAKCSIALGLGCAEEEDLEIWSHHGAEAAEKRVIEYLSPRGIDGVETWDDTEGRMSCGSSSADLDMASIQRDDTRLLQLLRLPEGRRESRVASSSATDEASMVSVDDFEFEIAEEDTGYDLSADGGSGARRQDTLWRFCSGSILRYVDFDVHSREYDVLHTEDFSWEEHGFSLVKRYFPGETGQILEDQFNVTSRLTYKNYGRGSTQETHIDTSPYRNAIWYYVHRVFGICHDDYDYRDVNVFLNRPTKVFIKKVACTPWKVTKDDFDHFDYTLSASEKCHVTLLVAEARKQAGLMYALRAVMQHMR